MRGFVILAVILFCSIALADEVKTKKYHATFHSCYDGDTCYFDFHIGAGVGLGVSLGAVLPRQGVRLCDINTPEIRGGTLETKRLAKLSRDRMSEWLSKAKSIQVEIPQKNNCDHTLHVNCDKTEKYGRWLGYIWADGVNLNEKLLTEGLATVMVSKATGKPILCKPQ